MADTHSENEAAVTKCAQLAQLQCGVREREPTCINASVPYIADYVRVGENNNAEEQTTASLPAKIISLCDQ